MRASRNAPLVASLLLAVAVLTPLDPLRGQAADTMEVAEARVHVAEGEYDVAADLLRRYLERHPDDVGVRWLLARTLYWDGAFEATRRQLRLALRRDPDHGQVRELWREMRVLWAPRIGADLGLLSDDQPLDRLEARIEGIVPLSPRVALLGEGSARRLDAPRPGAVVAYEARIGLRASVRDAPVRLSVLGGVHARPSLDRRAFVGRGRLSLALGEGFEAGLAAARWSYEHTGGAVDTLVAVETLEAELSRADPTGFAGSAGGRLDRFPDGNGVTHAWAWLLAPVWSDGGSAIRIGYAFQHQDADSTTFRPVDGGPGGPGTGGPPGGGPGRGGPPGGVPGGSGSEGVYDPYYTPEGVRAHLALAAVQAALSPAVVLSADGGVGLAAEERAPELVADSVAPSLRFVPRDYTPWRIRGRLSAELSPSTTLRLEGAWREEAFFRTASASLGLSYRFFGGLWRP